MLDARRSFIASATRVSAHVARFHHDFALVVRAAEPVFTEAVLVITGAGVPTLFDANTLAAREAVFAFGRAGIGTIQTDGQSRVAAVTLLGFHTFGAVITGIGNSVATGVAVGDDTAASSHAEVGRP